MRKYVQITALFMVLLSPFMCMARAVASDDTANKAVSFVAYPGIYLVGEDFPSGIYCLQCAKESTGVSVLIEDNDGAVVLEKDYSQEERTQTYRIRLVDGYSVIVDNGVASFSPSIGGVVFSDTAPVDTSVAMASSDLDSIISKAVTTLTAFWKSDYEKDNISENGYLEIKNTRVIAIQKAFQDESIEIDDSSAKRYFSGVAYVVEFVLYSDYYGTSPFYGQTYLNNCVIIYKDGTCQVSRDPFDLYRARSYNTDFSEIIARIDDLGTLYNATYELIQ